ncbi:MAG: protein of unknown function DUF86 [Candidatus Ozemobacter sibiricus]|uniref:DUF86 domain-containing protein n=1 Tax=Candidatus Ozemobacter sibiricus TaxID=2268124 RepID=A0A367ZQF1_9BACT|nr:MAG: protein of unknown function DUF86 [Candidatus Ozemobacter sibiricus]
MLAALQKIRRHTKGMDYKAFRKDDKTVDAVCRNSEIPGEAAGRLSRAFRLRHGQIDWPGIIGCRNRIIHEYFGVDRALRWAIIQNDVPAMRIALRRSSVDAE